MQTSKEILDRIKEKNINVQQIARQSGLPSARIYKWLTGKGTPKVEDASILSKWAKNYLDKVPIVEEPGTTLQIDKGQPLDWAGLQLTVGDYIDEIKRSRAFLEKMLDGGMKELRTSLDEQAKMLSAVQSDLLAKSEVALNALAKIQNPKRPPKLNEEADRISQQRQGMTPHIGTGKDGIDD